MANYSGFVVELVVLAAVLLLTERKLSWRIGFTLAAFFLFRLMGEMIKTGVGWPRPCWDPAKPALIDCPNSFSSPSGHALGAMMVAVITGMIFRRRTVWVVGLSIASLVSFSRVIVGVHLPADVIIGGLLGAAFGWVAWRGYWRTS